jgi:hypothetical protein
MSIRKLGATLALMATLALFSPPVICQQAAGGSGAGGSVLPYPTRLRAVIKDKLIILGWIDSPEVKGGYAVYRSLVPLTAESFASATRLGEIAAGAQTYTDIPPDAKPYFYAVLGLAPNGTPYQIFVPTKNATSVSLSLGPSSTEVSNPASGPLGETAAGSTAQAFVSALSAKTKGDAIIISYKASPKSRLVLYRGSSPLAGAADLLDASLVSAFTDKDGSFTDFPVPGVEYYYAILGEEDLKAGRISIIPGVNALSSPVHVQAAELSSGLPETPPSSRTPPLPYFLIEDGTVGGGVALLPDEGPPPARPVAPDTEKAIGLLLAKAPKNLPALPQTRILPEEQAAPSGGEDYALSLLVSDRIAAKDWAGAAEQLRKYLSLNRGPKASARARFYLGEALAFMGSGREAFFEFLLAREFYPLETKAWIEYVLSTLPKS